MSVLDDKTVSLTLFQIGVHTSGISYPMMIVIDETEYGG